MSIDFTQITGRLFTGGGITEHADVQALVSAGVTAIIDCTDAEDDSSILLGQTEHIAYLWNPTSDDGSHKPIEWFQRSIEFALPLFAVPSARIYCHCTAGVNRGPSTTYAIMRAVGWDGAALTLLKERRPVVQARYAPEADTAITALGYG